MSSYRIAISSHDRAHVIGRKTLMALHNGGIPMSQVDVWVHESEYFEYDFVLPPDVRLRVHNEPLGRVGARDAVAKGYATGTRLVQMDDDLEKIVVLDCACRYREATRLGDHFEWAFQQADALGFGLWGVDGGGGRFPKTKQFGATTRLRWVAGGLFGYTLAGDACDFVNQAEREDDERTLRCGLRDGGVLLLEYMALRTNTYTEPGGMQNQRNDALIREGQEYLLANWPEHLTPVNRSDGRVRQQINLHRRYAQNKELIPGPEWARPGRCERCKSGQDL